MLNETYEPGKRGDNDPIKHNTVPNDNVNHPAHYTRTGIECIDAIEAAVCDLNGTDAFLTGQIIKYVWRWKWKNGAEDLNKARWYLDRLIRKVWNEEREAELIKTAINETCSAERINAMINESYSTDRSETDAKCYTGNSNRDERTAVEKAVDELFNALWSGNKQ